MKYLFIVFAFIAFCTIEIQAQNTESKLRKFEAELFDKGDDLQAVKLISDYREAKSVFKNHKSIILATYDQNMNQFEKNEKFKNDSASSEEVKILMENIKMTNEAKQNYLKSNYPEYLQLFNQKNHKKSPKRIKKHMSRKVQAQPIGGGN